MGLTGRMEILSTTQSPKDLYSTKRRRHGRRHGVEPQGRRWHGVAPKEYVMMQRVLTLSLAAMFVLAVSVVVAADKEKSDSKVVGTVSVAGDGKITVTDKDGN